jgi:threonine dehydrogenase-like Zn-dependent dehydrogenase
MEELVELLVRWNLRPGITVSHRLPLESAAEAYRLADAGESGKVCIVME